MYYVKTRTTQRLNAMISRAEGGQDRGRQGGTRAIGSLVRAQELAKTFAENGLLR